MEESKLNIGCIRFLKMNKDLMSCAHSNESRVVERLASRASKIESALVISRGAKFERKEFYPNFFRGLSAPIVGIFESTWVTDRQREVFFTVWQPLSFQSGELAILEEMREIANIFFVFFKTTGKFHKL